MRTKTPKVTIVVVAPSGRSQSFTLPYSVAWPAARGIARESHHEVTLFGQYGNAVFDWTGGGHVVWGDKSTTPGETTRFDANTTVCV